MPSLGEGLPREMVRVLRDVIPAYVAIGKPGAFALAMMLDALAEAAESIAAQDIAAMIIAYEKLKGFHT